MSTALGISTPRTSVSCRVPLLAAASGLIAAASIAVTLPLAGGGGDSASGRPRRRKPRHPTEPRSTSAAPRSSGPEVRSPDSVRPSASTTSADKSSLGPGRARERVRPTAAAGAPHRLMIGSDMALAPEAPARPGAEPSAATPSSRRYATPSVRSRPEASSSRAMPVSGRPRSGKRALPTRTSAGSVHCSPGPPKPSRRSHMRRSATCSGRWPSSSAGSSRRRSATRSTLLCCASPRAPEPSTRGRWCRRAWRSSPPPPARRPCSWPSTTCNGSTPRSAAAIGFALRRLDDHPVVLFATRRLGHDAEPLDVGVAEERLARIAVGPLAVDVLQRILQDQLGQPVPRPAVARLADVSGGNPYYALGAARAALREAGGAGLSAELPLPEGIYAVLQDRLSSLPEETREALGAVAAMGHRPPRRPRPRSTPGCSTPRSRRACCASRGTGSTSSIHCCPRRPTGCSPLARRGIHDQLAALAADVEQRARHLAAGSTQADSAIAADIEAGAMEAAARGAPAAAAELLDAPPARAGARGGPRPIAAVRQHVAAGARPRDRAGNRAGGRASARTDSRASAGDAGGAGGPDQRPVALRVTGGGGGR